MEAPRSSFYPKATFRRFSEQVPLKVHPAQKVYLIRCKTIDTVSKATFWYAITGILCLIEDAVASPFIVDRHNEVFRVHNRIEVLFCGPLKKVNDTNLRAVKFKTYVLLSTGNVTPFLRILEKINEKNCFEKSKLHRLDGCDFK